MAEFVVSCVDRRSGAPERQRISAGSPQEAQAKAEGMGYQVTGVAPVSLESAGAARGPGGGILGTLGFIFGLVGMGAGGVALGLMLAGWQVKPDAARRLGLDFKSDARTALKGWYKIEAEATLMEAAELYRSVRRKEARKEEASLSIEGEVAYDGDVYLFTSTKGLDKEIDRRVVRMTKDEDTGMWVREPAYAFKLREKNEKLSEQIGAWEREGKLPQKE